MKNQTVFAHIRKLNRDELIRLIRELANLRRENRAYLEAKFAGPEEMSSSLDHYKGIIKKEFFPDRGDPKMRLSAAKKALGDYRKATNDVEGIVELMVFYVETGVKFTNAYGDINEQFYASMEGAYKDAVDMLNLEEDPELTAKFRPRLNAIVEDTDGIGWGFHDSLKFFYHELG